MWSYIGDAIDVIDVLVRVLDMNTNNLHEFNPLSASVTLI